MPIGMMKKKFRLLSVLVSLMMTAAALCAPFQAAAYDLPADTTIKANAALLVNMGASPEEDLVLYEKNADAMKSPAALVRLMVGATAIKHIRDNNIDIDTMTGTYSIDIFNTIIAGSGLTLANMKIGEEWTIRDLLSVSMIHTAGDACATMAVTLSGSQAKFVAEMNALAAEIGCQNTNFANVTGVDSVNQYTSARDLYRIIRYAMDYPEFEPLFAAAQYTCHPLGDASARTYVNTNELLRSASQNYYSPAAFGKTGWTDDAGRCLAAVARDSGYEYLCVVLGCPDKTESGATNAHFTDTKTLFRWAFNNFTYKTLLSKNQPITQIQVDLAWNKDTVTLIPETDFATTVVNNLDPETIRKVITLTADSIEAPVEKGQVCGKVELYINMDEKIGEVNLIAAESIGRSQILYVWDQIKTMLTSIWFLVGVIVLVLLLIGYIVLNIVHNRQRRRNRMKKVRKFK